MKATNCKQLPGGARILISVAEVNSMSSERLASLGLGRG